MKGIILAGGTGTRLYPITKALNKHILPLYDKPAIYYTLSLLMLCDIRDIIIVCNPSDYNSYYVLLEHGSSWGISISYKYQNEPKGIINGVLQCKDCLINEQVMIVLGDNFFYGNNFINVVCDAIRKNTGATMFSLKRDYNHIITTIKFDENKIPIKLQRKEAPKNHYISPGLFLYDEELLDVLHNVTSIQNKNEWVYVNSEYLKRNKLKVINLGQGMFWYDVGMPESRLDVEILISQVQKYEGNYIGCLDEIAFKKGWIGKAQLEYNAYCAGKSLYKEHLLKVLKDSKEIF